MKIFRRNLKQRYIGILALGMLTMALAACSDSDKDNENVEKQNIDSSDVLANEEDTLIVSGEKQFDELQKRLADGEMAAAIAYIGRAEGEFEDIIEKYQEEQPVLAMIPEEQYIQFEGEELYLIIPISTCESVSVNEWICDEANGDVGETGQVLYRNESGEPVLVRGNVDDAVSNLQVIILTEKNGKSIFLDYHPGLSMQDKKLIPSEEPPILDFTVY